ncbi:MAG: glycosyltransferase family 2 protein [Trueperaceae bacterium]
MLPDQIVVIHHRATDALQRCLAALQRHTPQVPVRVLRTGGHDAPSGDLTRAHPHLRVDDVANRSYASAVNDALRNAGGERVAILNDDVFVRADTLPALCAPLHDPRVALAGPLARTPDGALQDQGWPYRLATMTLDGAGPRAVRDVAWLSGCLFVARRSAALHVGGMDASLRFFNEDLEWCLRLRRRGWRCVLVGAEVTHAGGASTPSAARFRIEGLRGGMVVARRHRAPVRRAAQRFAVWAWAAAAARRRRSADRDAWRAVARAFRHGRFDDAPFGAGLDDDAPGLPDAWPPWDGEGTTAPAATDAGRGT